MWVDSEALNVVTESSFNDGKISTMDLEQVMTTLLIILVVFLLLGGGYYGYRGRR